MSSIPGDSFATLRILGAPSIVTGRVTESSRSALPLGKPLALLAYLAVSPRRTASRDVLADLLWGDQERTTARQSVRRTLSTIRGQIGAWVFDAYDSNCTLSAAVTCDALSFGDLITRGELEPALTLYRGDFFDYASPGCRQFEMWAEVERAHYRSAALRVAETLCRLALDSGQHADARRLAARLREIDPHAELGWRLQIEAAIAAGDRVSGVAEASRFEAWLEREAIEPEPASRAIIRAARQTRTRTPERGVPSVWLSSDLVGREREFRDALNAWRRASDGSTQMITITGGAGLGKTRLLDAIADRLRSMRKRVVVARAYSGERGIPCSFAGNLVFELAQMPGASGVRSSVLPNLLSLDARLVETFPHASTSSAPIATSDRVTALRELLVAVCEYAPIALLLDDMHWCDEESRTLLSAVLARADVLPLLVVVTSRNTTTGLEIDGRTSAITVLPFSSTETKALVESIGALPAGADWPDFLIARVTAASRGIPLLVLGALEDLVKDGVLTLQDGGWTAPDEPRLRERLRNINALAARLRALSDGAFRLLLACGIAGRPLPASIVASVASSLGDPDAPSELERAGYLRTMVAGVEVTHDAVAETVLEIADPALQCEVRHTLGRVLCGDSDLNLVEMGVRHLAFDADLPMWSAPLVRAFASRIAERPERARDVIARILARRADDTVVDRAYASLPFTLRFRRWRSMAIAASAIIALVAATGAAIAWRVGRESQPTLQLMRQIDATHRVIERATFDPVGWREGAPIWATTPAERFDTIPIPQYGRLVVPGRDAWAVGFDSPDSGGADIGVIDERRELHRLTWSHADESPMAWSPDGRLLAITTSALSHDEGRGLGLLDVSSGRVTAIEDRLWVSTGAWSPDGSRIAYAASARGEEPYVLCIATVDARHKQCDVPFGHAMIRGWTDARTVLVQEGPLRPVLAFDVVTGTQKPLDVDDVFDTDLSPDGRWLSVTRISKEATDIFIAPSDNPHSLRPIASRSRQSRPTIQSWVGRYPVREYLASVRIRAAADSIPIGSPYELSAAGVSNTGREMPVQVSDWRSSDTTIAVVDDSGRVTPRRAGRVTIELSVGGWRRTRHEFVVVGGAGTVLLNEDWKALSRARWVPFGTPFPTVVADSALGRAFFNNGDGWYFSGAYSTRRFDAKHGLALDVTLRMPITREKEQYLEVGLGALTNLAELRKSWDHRTGYLPKRFRNGDNGDCILAYPAGEGPQAKFVMKPGSGLVSRDRDGIPWLAKGKPLHLRIQLFPDGRCGFALEGEPPQMVPGFRLGTDSVAILLQGNSVGTRLLVGPMVLRQGVPPGTDWSGESHRGKP